MSKKINVYKNGKFDKKFNSILECSNHYNISLYKIQQFLKGRIPLIDYVYSIEYSDVDLEYKRILKYNLISSKCTYRNQVKCLSNLFFAVNYVI